MAFAKARGPAGQNMRPARRCDLARAGRALRYRGKGCAAPQPYDAIRATLTPIQADTAVSTAPQVTSVTTIRQFQPFSTAHEVNS